MHKFILAYFILFITAFFYMALHSIIGLDEVMLLDPCVNLLKDNYSSRLWYAPGTENVFMAYLPATSCLRLLFLVIFPDNMFFNRLPFILVFFLCAWLIYKITKARFQDKLVVLLTVLFFINDKGLWDAVLSGRSEILQVLFILLYFFLEQKNSTGIISLMKGLVLGLLFLTHPPVWIIVFILLIFLYRKEKAKKLFISIPAFALPVLIYLFLINFNIQELAFQLFQDGKLGIAEHGFIYRLSHFYTRFLPYPYLYLPWVIVLFAVCLAYIFSLKMYKEKQELKICIIFISYLVFLLVVSENYYRYNPPLLVCMYLLLPSILKYLQEKYRLKISIPAFIIITIIISIPFTYRSIKIFQNRESNDAAILINQFKTNMDVPIYPGSALIIGDPVGYYLSHELNDADYSTIYTLHKFDSKNYKAIYYLRYDTMKETNYKLVYEFLPGAFHDGTYRGLKLYEKRPE